jgi:hypothetical protein
MLKKALLSILAIIVLFEEWLWDILTLCGKWLARVLHLEKFDERLALATPNQAVVALLIPLLLVTPINVAALMVLARGAIWEGVLLEVVAKLLGTLLVARVFRLVRSALMTFRWFAAIYDTITGILKWAHDLVRSTALYRLAQQAKQAIKERWKAMRGT